MKIGGFTKNSMIDYPGKVASVIFTQGCNLRCKYCHNPQLVLPELMDQSILIPELYVLDYLEKNKVMLDGIVITGGEPTIQEGLEKFIQKVKLFGLYVKLDTNGTQPDIIENLINQKLVDFIAMDVKAPLNIERYSQVSSDIVKNETIENIKKSISLIINSGIKHEFRTTVVKQLLNNKDIENICESIKGCEQYSLQDFNSEKTLDKSFQENCGFSAPVLEWLSHNLEAYVNVVKIR